ncbi:DNA-directed RNA polymerase subunit alpha [Spiroplasma endosymbiont of Anurida maritima]|uniref:DNA-directed RNA polymerase subunit alpha n=1 Tax=Spiroplasma endosymbiont of Anurida maritima TaxID=2967972 RepID=UPI0036D2E553
MKPFIRPEFSINSEDKVNNSAVIVAEPLEKGFGDTLGNAIRRTLLFATPGAAVYALKVKGASHEFTALEGVLEHMTQIVLNIKDLVIKINPEIYPENESVLIKGIRREEGELLSGDLEVPEGVEIINKDLVIATVADGGNFEVELYAKNSRGYKTVEENKKDKKYTDLIVIDANFSPIEKVSYHAKDTKVGKSVDLEKLEIIVKTNGSIEPMDAVAIAGKVINDHMEFFVNLKEELSETNVIATATEEQEDELDRAIEELEFTQRSQNCLKREQINTVRDLITKTEDEIETIRNLGKKSLTEIKEKVKSLGLEFKKD